MDPAITRATSVNIQPGPSIVIEETPNTFETALNTLREENMQLKMQHAEQKAIATELRIENGALQGKISNICIQYESEIKELAQEKANIKMQQLDSKLQLDKQIEVHGDINLMNQEHDQLLKINTNLEKQIQKQTEDKQKVNLRLQIQ